MKIWEPLCSSINFEGSIFKPKTTRIGETQRPATSAHQTQSFQRWVQVGIITCQRCWSVGRDSHRFTIDYSLLIGISIDLLVIYSLQICSPMHSTNMHRCIAVWWGLQSAVCNPFRWFQYVPLFGCTWVIMYLLQIIWFGVMGYLTVYTATVLSPSTFKNLDIMKKKHSQITSYKSPVLFGKVPNFSNSIIIYESMIYTVHTNYPSPLRVADCSPPLSLSLSLFFPDPLPSTPASCNEQLW